jgi:hypothetical protein
MVARSTQTTEGSVRDRPIGLTVLAALAGVAFVLAVVHLLQAIGLIPYFIGAVAIRDFSLWYALMWGLMVWVWAWAIRAILEADPSAWVFLLIVSGFSLMFDFFTMIASPTTTTDLTLSFLLSLAIFAYTLLPSTKRTFAVQ